jgi:hypothetical protein
MNSVVHKTVLQTRNEVCKVKEHYFQGCFHGGISESCLLGLCIVV